jgi:hypothetical protein
MMSRYRRNRRKQLRGGGDGPSFAEGGNKPGPSAHFEHNEPPTASESVRQQQAGAVQDAEMQMAMNQTGGAQRGGSGEEELTVPQSGAASPEGNDAMAQSAGMLMQSRQNAPANTDAPQIKAGGRKKRKRTRRRKKRKRTKKRRRRKKRKTKRKYKFAKKYRQKGCSRKRR